MSTLVIEHFKASELPQQWAQHLKVRPEHTVTVRIETEATQTAQAPEAFVTNDPAFGIWRDREDMADVLAYVRQLRAARYSPNGSRQGEQL
jgi:diaminopimelate decarboxylase